MADCLLQIPSTSVLSPISGSQASFGVMQGQCHLLSSPQAEAVTVCVRADVGGTAYCSSNPSVPSVTCCTSPRMSPCRHSWYRQECELPGQLGNVRLTGIPVCSCVCVHVCV